YGSRSLDPPANLQAIVNVAHQATLYWTPPVLACCGPNRVEIWRAADRPKLIWAGADRPLRPNIGLDLVHLADASTSDTFFTDSGLTAGRTYFYALRSVQNGNQKSWFTPEMPVVPFGIVARIIKPTEGEVVHLVRGSDPG